MYMGLCLVMWSLIDDLVAQREKFEQKPVVTRKEMKAFFIRAKSGKKAAES